MNVVSKVEPIYYE